MGIHVDGGEGATSRKTPTEIEKIADAQAITPGADLVRASKLSAKVDSAGLQDGYELYHHSFFFTPGGEWCVVQQGMSEEARYARRYHWLGEGVKDFVCEPHYAIEDLAARPWRRRDPDQLLLNMVAQEAGANRE